MKQRKQGQEGLRLRWGADTPQGQLPKARPALHWSPGQRDAHQSADSEFEKSTSVHVTSVFWSVNEDTNVKGGNVNVYINSRKPELLLESGPQRVWISSHPLGTIGSLDQATAQPHSQLSETEKCHCFHHPYTTENRRLRKAMSATWPCCKPHICTRDTSKLI